MYQRILLAYDGSEPGQKALLDCRDIAQWSKAELFLIAVRPLPGAAIGIDRWITYGTQASNTFSVQAIDTLGNRSPVSSITLDNQFC